MTSEEKKFSLPKAEKVDGGCRHAPTSNQNSSSKKRVSGRRPQCQPALVQIVFPFYV